MTCCSIIEVCRPSNKCMEFLNTVIFIMLQKLVVLDKMSLISQNAIPKENRKRRRERKKKDEVLEIEQEREMKKLENFLFGSLYYPIEFGEDNEETRDEVDSSSELFFMDRSANGMLSAYEDDADLAKETSDEEEISKGNLFG
ncbi:U3 small nucleolar RNA-associated protein 18-like protein [Abeliophyllum distichum]|uniref:U3 small nucleolar RNA-associated protein 18-like protein n=1 Tax=Abeliophyllum distichum TaxID=126358 RepID=A0ABD1RPI1_9LAMI